MKIALPPMLARGGPAIMRLRLAAGIHIGSLCNAGASAGVCDWGGVTCSGGRVTGINLYAKVGLGRIIVSEIETPNTLANLA